MATSAMAEADEAFYRDVVRAGYRGPYLKTLAEDALLATRARLVDAADLLQARRRA